MFQINCIKTIEKNRRLEQSIFEYLRIIICFIQYIVQLNWGHGVVTLSKFIVLLDDTQSNVNGKYIRLSK